MPEPKTLLEAVRHFSSLDTCHAYMVSLKWDSVGNIASRAAFAMGLV